jgi:hypothetical protein
MYLTRYDQVNNPDLLRRFVSLTHEIHVLAHSCIDHYIQRSLDMRPSSLIKHGASDIPPYGRDWLKERYDRAESRPYQPHSTGPPSWVEEQRAIKAMWRIHFFFEINLHQSSGQHLFIFVIDLDSNISFMLTANQLSFVCFSPPLQAVSASRWLPAAVPYISSSESLTLFINAVHGSPLTMGRYKSVLNNRELLKLPI